MSQCRNETTPSVQQAGKVNQGYCLSSHLIVWRRRSHANQSLCDFVGRGRYFLNTWGFGLLTGLTMPVIFLFLAFPVRTCVLYGPHEYECLFLKNGEVM